MKSAFIIPVIFFAMSVLSCSKTKENVTNNKLPNQPIQNNLSSPLDAQELMIASDCYACHKQDSKFLGPSWYEIAQKYSPADIDFLSKRIIEGGTGNWGELYMTPHHKLSKEETKIMVEYILTITNN